MRLTLLVALGMVALPALAQTVEETAEPLPFGGLHGRVMLSHSLVIDLIEQYDLSLNGIEQDPGPDPGPAIPLAAPETLDRWTLPVVDDAASALQALETLEPNLADPFTMAEARAAITDVEDNLAWDDAATVDALHRLAGHLGALSATLQQAALPQDGEPPPQ